MTWGCIYWPLISWADENQSIFTVSFATSWTAIKILCHFFFLYYTMVGVFQHLGSFLAYFILLGRVNWYHSSPNHHARRELNTRCCPWMELRIWRTITRAFDWAYARIIYKLDWRRKCASCYSVIMTGFYTTSLVVWAIDRNLRYLGCVLRPPNCPVKRLWVSQFSSLCLSFSICQIMILRKNPEVIW